MRGLLALVAVCVCLSLVAATAPLLGAQSDTVVPDQYLIVFHTNSTTAIRDLHVAELLAKRFIKGDKLIRVFDIGTLIGYSAKLSKETLASELSHPNIKYIEADQYVSIYDTTVEQRDVQAWGIDRIDHADLPLTQTYWHWESGGQGVTAYVIDTGVRTTHVEFRGEQGASRASFGVSFIGGEDNNDNNGHGTHVAGTIGGNLYGVAKKVSIIAVKVLSAGGSGTWEGVIAGIEWVTKHHTDRGRDARSVANMSLGGGVVATVDEAVRQSVIAGVHHAIAAGNSYGASACNYSPARAPNATTVGSTTRTDARSSFSNIGPCVDIFAPGDGILSAWSTSDTATSTISGTSMASPHVAGTIASIIGHLLADGDPIPPTPAQIDAYLKQIATPNKITDVGAGSPNLLLFNPSAY